MAKLTTPIDTKTLGPSQQTYRSSTIYADAKLKTDIGAFTFVRNNRLYGPFPSLDQARLEIKRLERRELEFPNHQWA